MVISQQKKQLDHLAATGDQAPWKKVPGYAAHSSGDTIQQNIIKVSYKYNSQVMISDLIIMPEHSK